MNFKYIVCHVEYEGKSYTRYEVSDEYHYWYEGKVLIHDLESEGNWSLDQVNDQELVKKLEREFVFKQNHLYAFTEWAAMNFFKMHGVWCHRYADQRKKENHLTTEQLAQLYKDQNGL